MRFHSRSVNPSLIIMVARLSEPLRSLGKRSVRAKLLYRDN